MNVHDPLIKLDCLIHLQVLKFTYRQRVGKHCHKPPKRFQKFQGDMNCFNVGWWDSSHAMLKVMAHHNKVCLRHRG